MLEHAPASSTSVRRPVPIAPYDCSTWPDSACTTRNCVDSGKYAAALRDEYTPPGRNVGSSSVHCVSALLDLSALGPRCVEISRFTLQLVRFWKPSRMPHLDRQPGCEQSMFCGSHGGAAAAATPDCRLASFTRLLDACGGGGNDAVAAAAVGDTIKLYACWFI